MSNVLYEPLPEEWNGYRINTWFQVGVQLSLLMDDEEMSGRERYISILNLLFGDENGNLYEFPKSEQELFECVAWFLNGWSHDNHTDTKEKEKIMDFYVDQGRIYADFRQIYGINLNEADMHWWEFCWLLWNMPDKLSSFKQAIQIRTMKPRKGASREEIQAIAEGKAHFALKQKNNPKVYSKEEEKAIDEYDRRMEEIRKKKLAEAQALIEFRK